MKKQFAILALLAIGFITQGQTLFLKIGPSFSKISTDATPGASQVTEVNGVVGIGAIAGINYLKYKYFNLSSGIGIIQGGGEVETVSFFSQVKNFTVRLNFLTINTTFNLKIPVKEVIEPYIFAGPKLDYLFSYTHIEDLYNTNPEINKVIYGALLGAGIKYKLKKVQLGLSFDYYLNLNKVIDNQKYDETLSVSASTVNAVIGYVF